MITVETVIQKTTSIDGKPVFRTIDRGGEVSNQAMAADGQWQQVPSPLVSAILTAYGAGPADVQPSAPEAEAPTVVTAPAGPAPE
jgi:hypothetical protein